MHDSQRPMPGTPRFIAIEAIANRICDDGDPQDIALRFAELSGREDITPNERIMVAEVVISRLEHQYDSMWADDIKTFTEELLRE